MLTWGGLWSISTSSPRVVFPALAYVSSWPQCLLSSILMLAHERTVFSTSNPRFHRAPPTIPSTVLYVKCDHTIFPLTLFSTLSVLVGPCFFFHPLLAPCLLLVLVLVRIVRCSFTLRLLAIMAVPTTVYGATFPIRLE